MAQPTPSPAAPGSKTAAPADNEPVLIARDLRKKYGSLQAVDGVSFKVASGEVFGILGPNGAGKTTTLEMIEGMRTIDSGSATVAGVDVARDPRGVKAKIGIQLQASSFSTSSTCWSCWNSSAVSTGFRWMPVACWPRSS